jgi:hypothetical protein
MTDPDSITDPHIRLSVLPSLELTLRCSGAGTKHGAITATLDFVHLEGHRVPLVVIVVPAGDVTIADYSIYGLEQRLLFVGDVRFLFDPAQLAELAAWLEAHGN